MRPRDESHLPASRPMPSPFPGMNPFLERDDVWPDFHHRLIDRMADAIADQVDPRYLVKIEEHLYVQEAPGLPHRAGPRADVGIKPSGPPASPGGASPCSTPRPGSTSPGRRSSIKPSWKSGTAPRASWSPSWSS